MFNKPNLFPKANEPQPARGRPTAGGQPGGLGAEAQRESSSPGFGSSGFGASQSAASGSGAGRSGEGSKEGESRLIVGPDVKLKGAEILDCDTLVVEGRVEATMDSRVLRIAEDGVFSGTVGVDVAEIHGQFDGELTARSQLIIHTTGRVSGKIRYGKIFIEEGGEISGDIKAIDSHVPSSKKAEESASTTASVPLRTADATG